MPAVHHAHRSRQPLTARQQTMVFWGVVLLLCLFGGVGSFAAGKYWLGRKLRDVEARTPKSVFQQQGAASGDTSTEKAGADTNSDAGPPPEKAVVNVEAREPTEGEKSDTEQEHGSKKHHAKKTSDDRSSDSSESAVKSSDSNDDSKSSAKSDESQSSDERSSKSSQKSKKKKKPADSSQME